MLGRHHVSLSVATVALVVLPLFSLYPMLTLIALVGTAIGSLIPDADSPDAAIFHSEVRGVNDLLNAPAVLYPVFGYVTKYLIYKPVVNFYDTVVFNQYDIGERHRGFLHSFLGLVTLTVVTGLYLLPILFVLDLLSIIGLGVFLAAYFVGAGLHLVEDSCTKSGIQWNFPFQSWKVRGRLTTTARPEDTKYQRGFLTVLGVGTGAMFFLPSLLDDVSVFLLATAGFVTVLVLWIGFSVGIARCGIDG